MRGDRRGRAAAPHEPIPPQARGVVEREPRGAPVDRGAAEGSRTQPAQLRHVVGRAGRHEGPPTQAQHARHLGQRSDRFLDVLEHVRGHDRVEARIVERQHDRVRDPLPDRPGAARDRDARPRLLDHAGRAVEPDEAEAIGKVLRLRAPEPPRPASDVEDVRPRRQRHALPQPGEPVGPRALRMERSARGALAGRPPPRARVVDRRRNMGLTRRRARRVPCENDGAPSQAPLRRSSGGAYIVTGIPSGTLGGSTPS